MRHLLLIIGILGLPWHIFAQTDENAQILIFRNTGEVNLFYTNEVDSINFSVYDKDSVMHTSNVSQVFFAKDTTLFVPICEIDSVTFGNRDKIEYKANVKLIDEPSIPYLVSYDGTYLNYQANTPASYLPKEGDRLFCKERCKILPNGLCARVITVKEYNGMLSVETSPVDFDEIFYHCFFAGTIRPDIPVSQRAKMPSRPLPLDATFTNLANNSEAKLTGETNIAIRVVVNPLQHYYFAKIIADTELGCNMSLKFKEATPLKLQQSLAHISFPPVYGILYPSVSVSGFVDLKAEAKFDYLMKRVYHDEWEWSRKNGTNTYKHISGTENTPTRDEAQIDITLDGEVFLGAEIEGIFSIIGDLAQGGLRAKLGPAINGEFSAGVLSELSQKYNAELYRKAELSFSGQVKLEGFTRTQNWFTNEIKEDILLEQTFRFNEQKISLFPEFKASSAVETFDTKEVTTSTKTATELLREIETGFELIDESDETTDSLFVGNILPDTKETQGFSCLFPPQAAGNRISNMRPIFHYAGYTIRAQETGISKGAQILPINTYGTNGVAAFISGASTIGSSTRESTLYNIGNYLPVNIIDTVFTEPKPLLPGIYITEEKQDFLIGSWTGEVKGDKVHYSFYENGKGIYSYKEISCDMTYQNNMPQSGDILLTIADGRTSALTVIDLQQNRMFIRFKGDKQTYTFTKEL